MRKLNPFARQTRERITLDLDDTLVYAIGDVHGCLAELLSLEEKIVADARSFTGRKLMILLGDYVDRGPESARVISHLLHVAPEGFGRICLAGNHDIAMLDYLEGRLGLDIWLSMGGLPTLFSYGIDPDHLARVFRKSSEIDSHIRANIPAAHAGFLRSLPVMVKSQRFVFVHAGIRPGISLDAQSDDDLVTIRSEFLNARLSSDKWIVHGHTRVRDPRPLGRRFGIDTGAFESGRLTALRIYGSRGRLIFS
ncbi:serine/threonine protein phosphatase [Aquamicrobium sp. LC103]|nr:serine/threonine protein phosphatase [Aquamicrobium sp. LC103]